MQYWLLTTEYPPQFGGGIGTYCKQLSDLLSDSGVDVTVFLPNRRIQDLQVRMENKVRIIEFSPYYSNTSSFLGYETMLSYTFAEVVRKFIEEEGAPDWVESQEYNGIAYYILQRKQLGEEYFKELKVLVTCHAPSFLYFEFNHVNTYKLPYFWIGEMERYCLQAADVCISPSQYLVDRLQERFDFTRKCYVLHNPYNPVEGSSAGNGGNVAVFLAKLSPSKGVFETLQCFKYLWDSGHSYKLKLIGDKNFLYHAKQQVMGEYIAKKYHEYVSKGYLEIAGAMHPDDVQKELYSARVVLVPSKVDNFPYTVLESMACKKVVLASKQGGHQEIIDDGINGLLFDHDVSMSFVTKVQEAFSLSALELKTIGESAASTVREKCSPRLYLNSKLRILERHCSLHSGGNQFKFLRIKSEINVDSPDVSLLPYDNELLSIVVPYFNMGPYIDETINSILNSSYKNIEVILVNDGSDDKQSIEKLEKLREIENVKIISQPNKGLASARNIGALEAKGRYLAFLDADDIVYPEYYNKAIQILRSKSNVHFVGCWVKYFEGANDVWPSFHPEPPYLLYHNMVNSSGLIYKRKSFLNAGTNDSKFIFGMEDYDSVISMVKNGYGGVVIPDILFLYRVRKKSMARGFNSENKAYLYQLLTEKHKDFYTKFATEITNLLNANGPGFMLENPTMDYLIYTSGTAKAKYLQKLHNLLKHQPLLRRAAITVYNKIK